MRVEILTPVNRLIFMGKVLLVKEDMIQVQEESGNQLPYVEYNSVVRVRGFANGSAFTLEGKIGGSTRMFWRIDRIRTLQASERREFFRQSVSVEGRLMCANGIFDHQEKRKDLETPPSFPCRVLDVSASGIRVRCQQKFKEGDWLFLTGISLDPDIPEFSFTCKIQRAKIDRSMCEYGCHFYELDERERERLIRALMTLQRKELQARRAQRGRM